VIREDERRRAMLDAAIDDVDVATNNAVVV
jgi:hypothetical protein